jgi:type I restriction enzyme S subunit
MSKQSYLEKLLDGEEVEWNTLGEVTQYQQPTQYLVKTKNYDDAFKTPVLTAGKTFVLGYTDETDGINRASQKPVIIFDDFTTDSKWVDFDFKAKSSAMKMISSSDNKRFILKYVYYWMSTMPSDLVEGDHKRQWISNFCRKQIPIPCPSNPKKSLAIQGEIVRILDAFTELTTELTTELNMRKKQYNYYRDRLFDFKDGDYVKWKPLGEVFDIFAGSDKPKDSFSDVETNEFNIPILSNGIGEKSLYGWTENAKVIEPSLTVSARGTIGWTSYRDQPFFPIIRLLVLTPKVRVNLKYAYYYMKTIEKKYNVVESGIPQLTKPMITGTPFPIPYPDDPKKSLAEQSRIVSILDKFDALTNSISEGLPREINLRQKQYEYYRDLLLSFPKSAEVDS